MTSTNRYHRWLCALGLALAACGDESGSTADFNLSLSDLTGSPLPRGQGAVDQAGAEARAVAFLGGVAVAAEQEDERGLAVWEVDVRRPSGALVEVDVVAATGDILEVECESPVAGDDLVLAPGFISLQEATRIATAARPGAVTYWEVELERDRTWVWELEVGSSDDDVEIDARTGAIRSSGRSRDDWDDADDDDDSDDDDD